MDISTSTLRKKMLGTFAVISATMLPYNVMAQDVTLESNDGKVNLVGELLGFADGTYKVRTGFGEFAIPAEGVTCLGDACPELEVEARYATVRFAGSDTVGLGIMPLLLEGYASTADAAATTDTQSDNEIVVNVVGEDGFGDKIGAFYVNSTSSGTAFKALQSGSADFGMASRRIKPEEVRSLAASGAGDMLSPNQEHIVAVDSLVIVTHPDNPVDQLSMDQLRAIYGGQIRNWSQVGGPDLEIAVMTRQESSGTRAVFEDRLFDGRRARVSRNAVIADDNNAMANEVATNEGAIGFVGSGYKRGAKALSLISECGITSEPDAFSAKTEEYPFQRRLYLYNRAGGLDSDAQDFVDYVTSSAADGVIGKAGFIDLSIQARKQDLTSTRARSLLQPVADPEEGNLMRDMLGKMLTHERLSATFRFVTGSSILDERGVEDIVRLVEYLEDQPSGTKVTLVGFTDSVGTFTKNFNLSNSRAEQVRNALLAEAGNSLNNIELAHTGFGEIAPTACNTNDFGRSVNRRVEVWIERPSNS